MKALIRGFTCDPISDIHLVRQDKSNKANLMKGVSHDKRSKSCSRSGRTEAWKRVEVLKPAEANHRAAAKANSVKPRNTIMRVASGSDALKPALLQTSIKACNGLSGVIGGSAVGQWSWELGRAHGRGRRRSATASWDANQ